MKNLFFAVLTMLLAVMPAMAETEGIGWIPTWKQGIAEAQRVHKPILLMSAAPHCGGVPGQW